MSFQPVWLCFSVEPKTEIWEYPGHCLSHNENEMGQILSANWQKKKKKKACTKLSIWLEYTQVFWILMFWEILQNFRRIMALIVEKDSKCIVWFACLHWNNLFCIKRWTRNMGATFMVFFVLCKLDSPSPLYMHYMEKNILQKCTVCISQNFFYLLVSMRMSK